MIEKITILQGDITQMEVDAIVNAANNRLMGGGGVDGAIHRAGGRTILDECRQIVLRQGGCKTGHAVITTAGKLNAQKVIHTVGPIWNGGSNAERELNLLARCYRSSLELCVENGLKTVAFPNISTGVYRFPKDLAAKTAIETVLTELSNYPDAFEKVIFVCFDTENYDLYVQFLKLLS
jgi:O-acetyl-ADP-ribose deacetylase (regulator of RNase III)